jgi:hypothetical protein
MDMFNKNNSKTENTTPKKNENHSYPYSKYILSPDSLGASTSPGALSNDVYALISYVKVLVSGNSNAQTIGGPLGNKYFMDTGGKCKDVSGVEHTRYVYINNIPDGKIPFISAAMGQNMSQFQGLVPGVMGNLTYINPAKLFTAFNTKTTCQQIRMPIRDISNNTSEESQYVADSDISGYNPCWFTSQQNPVTKENCRRGMTLPELPNDKIFQLYTFSIYVLGAYLLLRLVKKIIRTYSNINI